MCIYEKKLTNTLNFFILLYIYLFLGIHHCLLIVYILLFKTVNLINYLQVLTDKCAPYHIIFF